LQQSYIVTNEKPLAQFSYDVQENNIAFANNSVGATKYKWVFPDSESNEESPSKAFSLNGKYLVQLIAQNRFGCSDTMAKSIEIQIQSPVKFAKDFSPNADGRNDYFGPIVENPEDFVISFQVFNKTGKIVYQAKGDANSVAWDGIDRTTNRPAESDTYLFIAKIKDKNGNSFQEKGKFNLMK
jgi:gliding motility-associated-like protein